ncbi:MAG: D-alanyl-D-alanine dipeptidase [Rickettsiales bacterium]|jgi:zinc D-Ala-D-Ala dipeptidase|nr:D-alanyl-D-alanine dipeptidase [Rickettsiales bacterium]|tara:strand:+ start:5415 stop:6011 length:597 start_codon:yes stop_codon:yes gene_type:complete
MKLVEINETDFDLKLEIRYAGDNNLCSHKLYSKPFCYLNIEAASLLKNAINIANKHHVRLKIWDCYRPFIVQKYMYDFFSYRSDRANFISDPKIGTKAHCRGAAIDLTLIDKNNNELDMGTDFDEFSSLAYHANKEIKIAAQKNRILLLNIMTQAGFDFIPNEWWHYQLFDAKKYKIIESENDLICDKVLNSSNQPQL